jgi:predicted dithiol-disulfide oxidoreductase (DUF899 family)
MTTTDSNVVKHRVVSQDAWLKERLALLAEEKRVMHERDELAGKVRELPWVKVEKNYTFDSPTGKKSLADLFGSHSQLIVYHFMFDPTWSQGCKSCSFIADHYNGAVVHLAHRDISFVTVSKAPVEKLEAFRKRMGWTFPWVSGGSNDFGRDFGVSFTDQELADGDGFYNFNRKPYPIRELPGLSVFYKDEQGTIYHTYSTYARGLDNFLTAYQYMDVTPKGRDEAETPGMGWLRHHDRYDGSPFVQPWLEKPGITGPVMQ